MRRTKKYAAMTQDEGNAGDDFAKPSGFCARDLIWEVCQMEVQKVLWPTDFSDNAEKALDYVTSLSERYQTEVHVLYVIPELALHESWYGEFDKSHIDKIQEWEKDSQTAWTRSVSII
jgi:hypothetical protein